MSDLLMFQCAPCLIIRISVQIPIFARSTASVVVTMTSTSGSAKAQADAEVAGPHKSTLYQCSSTVNKFPKHKVPPRSR